MLSLRSNGWVREQDPDSHLRIDADEFTRQFRFVLPGYNLRPTEMQAAVGREQLKKLPRFVEKRRENARKFHALMAAVPHVRVQEEVGESSWFGFSLLLEGALEGAECETLPLFNLQFPKSVEGVDSTILNPRNTWADKEAYDASARKLAEMFVEAFKTFTDTPEGKALESAGPQLD